MFLKKDKKLLIGSNFYDAQFGELTDSYKQQLNAILSSAMFFWFKNYLIWLWYQNVCYVDRKAKEREFEYPEKSQNPRSVSLA